MPKRRNPFGECSPLQFKQHIGVKEVDLGVDQEQKMKSVYERTHSLLFSGAKRSFEVPTDANCNEIYDSVPGGDSMEEEMSVCPRQLTITNSGQLTNSGADHTSVNAFQALMNARKGHHGMTSCQCCKGQAASQDRCGFCEKSVCYDCVRPCQACDGNFCQLCSVMNPEVPIQQWYCQQCSYRLNPYIYWTTAY